MESDEEGGDDGSEAASLADLCELDAGSDEDPSFDPAADRGPDGEAALWSRMARLSISARKGRKGSVAPKMGKEDNDLSAMVDKLMRDGQLEKLKVYECKAYLRMHKLRLSGKKEELLNRIRDHIEVKTSGDVKYPVSSFVLNCKGDACKGDVVIFEQNIYRRKKGEPRGVRGRLCGQRTNAGRIIKESYGTAKQQHTFTVEIFWSKGYKPWPPLHPLLIKGRNLYKDKTMRQPWPDEHERSRVLQEKHARGFIARKSRDVRIHEKEIDKMRRFNRVKESTIKGQESMNQISCKKDLPQQKVVSMNTVDQRFDQRMTPSLQHAQPGNARHQQQQQISSKQNPADHLLHQQFMYHQQCNEVLPHEGATRTFRPEFIDRQVPSVQHVKPETTRQQQILSRPAPAQQICKHPTQHNADRPTPAQQVLKHLQEHNNHHQHNKVLPWGDTTRSFGILGRAPCLQHGGSGSAMPPEIISKPVPVEQIRNQPQPLKHQHVGPANARQHHIVSKPTLPQQIKNPPEAPKHEHHNEVLRPSNKDFRSRNQVEDNRDHGQMTREQYHPQGRHHQNQYGRKQTTKDQYPQPQKIHYQNHHNSWGMNHNQYYSQENHHRNYWYAQQFPPLKPCAQQFPPLKPCRYYQRGLWCPYEENCKFSHGS